MNWLMSHWQDLLLGLIALDTALVRLFPNIGFFGQAEKDLEAVAKAAGVEQKQP